MHLTQYTDIGMRGLMYLTQHNRDSLVTVGELAEQFSLSYNHVNKVVNQMVNLGWIHSVRGRNGGLSLSIAPNRLKLGTLIRALEVDQTLIDCEKAECILDGHCCLQGIINQAMESFYKYLDQYTLADIVQDPTSKILMQMHRHWKAG